MGRPVLKLIGLVAFATLSGMVSSRAATISADDASEPPVIRVDGQLISGDDRAFAELSRSRPWARVALNSPGGNLFAGLAIGRAIHARGYVTEIRPDAVCASACAFAWLGGRKRLLSDRGLLGFHAAYTVGPNGPVVSAGGNALVGAYLNEIGLDTGAILFVMSSGPDAMTWTSLVGARRAGLDADDLLAPDRSRDRVAQAGPRRIDNPPRATPTEAYSSLPGAREVDWTRQGEWVQAASRRSLDEAVAVAEDIRRRTANVSVFQYQNGWYGVVVGPFSPGRGTVALSALVSAAEVPADSIVTRGALFSALAWGRPKARAIQP